MRGLKAVASISIAVGLIATVSVASAAAVRGYVDSKGRIHGCVGAHGALSVVKAGHSCPKHTRSLVFNQAGKRGQKGKRGPAGTNATVSPLVWTTVAPAADTAGCLATHFCFDGATKWRNFSTNDQAAGFTRDAQGLVMLRGVVQAFYPSNASVSFPCVSGGSGSTVFTLPAGDRPAEAEVFGAKSGDGQSDGEDNALAEITVHPSGAVECSGGATSNAGLGNLFLSGISFSAG
jgi:hypothetical protein